MMKLFRPLFCFAFLLASPLLPKTASAAPSSPPAKPQSSAPGDDLESEANLPGPLRPFLRMAGLSQQISASEVLPLLARNVTVLGYNGTEGAPKPTEYLVLLKRYVEQARELAVLAGASDAIHVSNCSESDRLLKILGYKLREPCGPNTSLETSDPERAFLAVDSGFPVAELEETLRGGKPLTYPFASTKASMLFTAQDWVPEKRREDADVLDVLLGSQALARLYWSLSQMDSGTALALKQSPGIAKLVALSPALDFYGSRIFIRSGAVEVPGGAAAEGAWKDLVGASPQSPTAFVTDLISKDAGWMAAYFDALSRVSNEQQAYFTNPQRLKRFYAALRGPDVNPSAVRGVFRPDPGLLLLATRIQFDSDGQPHIPGNLQVWKDLLHTKSTSKATKEWSKIESRVNNQDQFIEAMFAFSRVDLTGSRLQVYLTLNEIDRGRPVGQRLTPETVRLLGQRFAMLGDQYSLFAEFPGLSNASVVRFVQVVDAMNGLSDLELRANTAGAFQANVGIWQILARQGQISSANLNDSWSKVLEPFTAVHNANELFDASRTSLAAVFQASTGKATLSQSELLALLAGPSQPNAEGQQVRQQIAARMRATLDDQRLVPVDSLYTLADGLNAMAERAPATDELIRLAGELRENEMPKPLFTPGERTEWSAGLYHNRHIETQKKIDIGHLIQTGGTARQFTDARAELALYLRDTLVGINYAYYEPPGAQVLHTNPFMVRSHDFSGESFSQSGQGWRTPVLIGRGSTASGGAHLAGSLADLPYALAQAEQNFIVPQNVQALVWEEMVPSLLTSAVVPRWWNVTRNELHAVTLYQRTGEELLAASIDNEQTGQKVMTILSDRLAPARYSEVQQSLRARDRDSLLGELTPGETFYLTSEFRRRNPGETQSFAAAGKELEELSLRFPNEVSAERLSHDFGTPHPILTKSYARELLGVQPFPAFMGYPSRLLAESWESNTLYWARLADESGYAPVALNNLVPELTRRMVEKIFASNFEDWPALLRAMHETGDEFRKAGVASLQKTSTNGRP